METTNKEAVQIGEIILTKAAIEAITYLQECNNDPLKESLSNIDKITCSLIDLKRGEHPGDDELLRMLCQLRGIREWLEALTAPVGQVE